MLSLLLSLGALGVGAPQAADRAGVASAGAAPAAPGMFSLRLPSSQGLITLSGPNPSALLSPRANLLRTHEHEAGAGVVCPIRTVRADPAVDAGVIRRAGRIDEKIIRDDVASCLK